MRNQTLSKLVALMSHWTRCAVFGHVETYKTHQTMTFLFCKMAFLQHRPLELTTVESFCICIVQWGPHGGTGLAPWVEHATLGLGVVSSSP